MIKIKILIPIYNDWQSAFKLLQNINSLIEDLEAEISILIVNDCSTEKRPKIDFNLNNFKSIHIINMKKNRGHARCNAAGLKYIYEKDQVDYILPMDGDGEDRPEEIKLLISKALDYPDKAVTANRVKRSEGLIFKFCYFIHKYLTFIFTGELIRFGHFSCLPKHIVEKMINEKATWNSFSGALVKISKDRANIPSERGTRYFGSTKMTYITLLKHSFSIMAVFKKTLLVRSILFLITYLFLIIGKISIITLVPIILVLIMMVSVILLSSRENILEYKTSLENIENIDQIK